MPRGGARVGAGRKPKDNVVTMPGTVPAAELVVPEPPADMVAAEERTKGELAKQGVSPDGLPWQTEIWREYAPLVVANGTLTPQSLPGFRALVEVTALYRGLWDRINLEGWQVMTDFGPKKHPLWTELRGFLQRREQFLRSYGLLANGKPIASKAGADAADPWAARAERRKA